MKSLVKVLLAGCLCLVGMSGALSQAAQAPEGDGAKIAAIIGDGDQAVSVQELRDYARQRMDLRPLWSTMEGRRTVLGQYIMMRLLVREGLRLGVEREQDDEPGRGDQSFLADDRYAAKVYQLLAAPCDIPSDERAVKDYYDRHPDAFTLPSQVRLDRIILPRDMQVGPLPAPYWMALQARAVAERQARFEVLVDRAREQAPNLGQGDIGWVLLDQHAELLRAIDAAGLGDMVGPFEEGDHVILLRVTDKRAARQLPWEEVRHQARSLAVQHCKSSEEERVQRELHERYRVEMRPEVLKMVTPR